MAPDARPAVVAFDGSAAAATAVRAAATLLRGRRLLVASVWEPGLAYVMTPVGDVGGLAYPPPRPEQVVALDHAQHAHALATAEAGVALARELGARAEPAALADDRRVAETIIELADEHDACAIVVGSRGLGRMRGMLGSTSRALLAHTHRPVLVVRQPDERHH